MLKVSVEYRQVVKALAVVAVVAAVAIQGRRKYTKRRSTWNVLLLYSYSTRHHNAEDNFYIILTYNKNNPYHNHSFVAPFSTGMRQANITAHL